MSSSPLRLACIGAFGHASDVLGELIHNGLAIEPVGWAPAYAAEPAESFLKSVPMLERAPRFDRYSDLLDQGPDWVIVSTRLDHIAAVTADSLRSGAHVIAEKPLAISLAELSSLRTVWQASGRYLGTMLSMENEPAFLAAKQIFRENKIGRAVLIEVRKSYRWGERPSWFGDSTLYGGTFPWIGIHALNIVNFITSLRFVRGFAYQANLAHPTHPGCEDACSASLVADNGALINISLDLLRPNGAHSHGDDWCRIVGTDGVLESNASEGWCRLLSIGPLAVDCDLPAPGSRYTQAIDRVKKGDLFAKDTETAFHLTEISLLARDFAKAEQPFRLENIPKI